MDHAPGEPEKNWKFSAADVRERAHWKNYREAYEEMVRETVKVDKRMRRGFEETRRLLMVE